MIPIPKTFQLGGRTWYVNLVDSIDGDPKMYGDCDSTSCVIRLRTDIDPDIMQHTFYHELCHAICFTLGWTELNEDEDKIDAFANILLQYLKTKEGQDLESRLPVILN